MLFPYLQKALVALDDYTDRRERAEIEQQANALYIQLYNGYANAEKAFVRGRVLRPHRRFRAVQAADGMGTNLMNTYFRIYSQEVADVQVRLSVGNSFIDVVSDNEGYIFAEMPLVAPLAEGKNRITAQIIAAPFEVLETTVVEADCFVPPANAAFGVISDIDDTTIISKTYSALQMIFTLFCVNAFHRKALPDVPKWYNTLSESGKNPFFYVSSSPWNIYDILVKVFDLQGVPAGPLMLRDYGIDADKFVIGAHWQHKGAAIAQLLDAYPHLNFMLFGDTAQHDTEIYCTTAEKYGDRISAIYIRDVGLEKDRRRALPLIEAASTKGVNIKLI